MKIVVLDGYTENPGDLSWEALESLGEVTIYDRTLDHSQIISRIGNAEIVYTNKTPIEEEVFKACTNLKYIGVLATGYNVVDIDAANQKGVIVTNVPTYGTDAVAQHTIALLLELCHHVGDHFASVKCGDWTKCIDWCFWNYQLVELAGKTMGIIGLGNIGKRTAEIARAFGMNVLAYSHRKRSDSEEKVYNFVEMEELLEKSDVISLHCPLSLETQGLINRNTIAKMKKGVLLINTSRGGLIIEQDLRAALESGKVGGAAVDVVSIEPIQKDNPLLNAPNMIITPHIAWASKEARQRLLDITIENLQAYLRGKPINVVN